MYVCFPVAAAAGRPFIFSLPSSLRNVEKASVISAKSTAEILARVSANPKLAAVVPASRLDVRVRPEMVPSGIPQLDLLTGGLARGCLTEICGAASSGRTSVLLFALARATQRGEVCALVDASDAFDPASGAAAGMEMSRLLWVRCGEKVSPRQDQNHALARPAGSAKTNDRYPGMSSGTALVSEKTGFQPLGIAARANAESHRPAAAEQRFRNDCSGSRRCSGVERAANSFGIVVPLPPRG
jgi:hypothetical protein